MDHTDFLNSSTLIEPDAFHDCIGIRFLSRSTIETILDRATAIKTHQYSPSLEGKTVAHVFFEPSTRTRLSFEIATQRCQAHSMILDVNHSSLSKGESIIDMMRNIEALGVHAIIVRHAHGGVPYCIHRQLTIPVINAGDGYHEHPSQGLLDAFTLREHLGNLNGKHIAILGDIAHSRVAKSNIWCLLALGATVTVVGPANLIPHGMDQWGVAVSHRLDDVLPTVDAVNVLRIQFERQCGISLSSLSSYRAAFGLTRDRQSLLKDNAVILHPGPVNRGVELDSDVADGDKNVILDQVANGVTVRMAILSMVMG